MKLKGLPLLAVLLILMASGGIASGQCDPDGGYIAAGAATIGLKESKQPMEKPKKPGKISESAFLPPKKTTIKTPWPNTHCFSDNNARSAFPGPRAGARVINIRSVPYVYGEMTTKYTGLLAGPDDWVYCLETPSKMLLAYHIPETSLKWSVQTGSSKPACLDNDGRVYYIHEDRNRLVRAGGTNGAIGYLKNLPHAGTSAVEVVGARVYTSVYAGGNTYMQSWTYDGVMVWDAGPFDGRVAGVAEDSGNGYVYVQTGECLYQLDWAGRQNWFRRHPIMSSSGGVPGVLPPVVGNNGDVWTYHWASACDFIFAKDGSITAQGMYGTGEMPNAVCYGSTGRFYAVSGKKLACYYPWDHKIWETELTNDLFGYANPAKFWVADIVMDGDGRLYAWIFDTQLPSPFPINPTAPATETAETGNHTYWQLINPSTGDFTSEKGEFEMDDSAIAFTIEDKPVTGGGEMAIGEDGKLILLHETGTIRVFTNEMPQMRKSVLPGVGLKSKKK